MEVYFFAYFFTQIAWLGCSWLIVYSCVKLVNKNKLGKTYTRAVRIIVTSIISIPCAFFTYYYVNRFSSFGVQLPLSISGLLLILNLAFR